MANKSRIKFTHDDVRLKPIENLYDGFFKINLYQFKHALFAGGESEVIRREILERGDAVAVRLQHGLPPRGSLPRRCGQRDQGRARALRGPARHLSGTTGGVQQCSGAHWWGRDAAKAAQRPDLRLTRREDALCDHA